MRIMAVKTAALVMALLAGGSEALGQKAADEKKPTTKSNLKDAKSVPQMPGKATQSLADMLAEALKNNPDIRVAEAKLQEANAELNRSQLKVTQKVVAAYHALESQKAHVAAAEADLERLTQSVRKGAVSETTLSAGKHQLILAKAKLSELQAELPYLLGKKSPQKGDKAHEIRYRLLYMRQLQAAQQAWTDKEILNEWITARVQSPRGTLADKLRKALDMPVTLKVEKTPLADVLKLLEDKTKGVAFRLVQGDLKAEPLSLDFKELPLGAAIQAIQDTIPGLRFVVRDYGVLVTGKDVLPPRALLLEDFWKGEAGDDPTTQKNPPAEDVKGVITKVNSSGLVSVSIGSDDGLRKGQTLEVFRLKPRPIYLGTLRILEVKGHSAAGKLLETTRISRQVKALQVGDQVASRIANR